MPEGRFCSRQPTSELDELRRAAAGLRQPPPQCLPGHVAALTVAQPDHVDDGTLGGVDAHGPASPDV